ncbi:hypothetical protein LCGC14_1010430 [marine sediment metagenome]|uniref:Pyridine nucleotide-disulphide oxidoreductase dimerisation domain-containing protein n=1 Tax=marine sediment metagenome TaxID=412755 RepID=A0A0F9N0I7_9ZZZZ
MLHVVDVSGSVDSSGKVSEVGTGDPISDYADIEEELMMWYHKILEGNRDKLSKLIKTTNDKIEALTDLYRGIGVNKNNIKETLKIIGASCIGVEAPELIAELSLAIKNDLTIHNVAETIHCHPTISEMVNEGCEAVIGKAIHKKGRPLHL